MVGLVTHIQRLSIHDGPGIRTVIFFKGCNFKCAWCHNPETISRKKQLEQIKSKCISCYECLDQCTRDALRKSEEGGIEINRQNCDNCLQCTDVCYTHSLEAVGTEYSVEALAKAALSDQIFYQESGGGVTISGGEPTLQMDFLLELLKLLKMHRIHTIVETNLSFATKKFEKLIPFIDLIIGDLKIIDENQHRRWTNQTNQKVLENIKWLDRQPINYELRTPVIDTINSQEQELLSIRDFINQLHSIKGYQLLPYHVLGSYKYENLGLFNPVADLQDMDAETLSRCEAYFEDLPFFRKNSET